jgi:hypothetical protein
VVLTTTARRARRLERSLADPLTDMYWAPVWHAWNVVCADDVRLLLGAGTYLLGHHACDVEDLAGLVRRPPARSVRGDRARSVASWLSMSVR